MATAKAGVSTGVWFIGKDLQLQFTVYTDETLATCLDASGYALEYVLRKGNSDDDPALITKTSGAGITVTGVFATSPLTNTQVVNVAIADTDTDGFKPGNYQHALVRTDSGSETVLLYSDADTPVILTKAAI